ncbi:MAG TPA: sialidase family protein [Candidatus Dormibacteraeota bacterium]|nr:sialidase family protein [Candidatus Dormibacteraeota bacterium]
MRRRILTVAAGVIGLVVVAPLWAHATPSAAPALVTTGSPAGSTPQNHQNEPAVAMDANNQNILIAGSNDFVDEQACPQPLALNAGTCLDRATGVGVSGDYFSFDAGHTWVQPTYTGWTTADCDPTVPCKGHPGPIHTLPWYYENGLTSFGDPAVAVGPVPGTNGFSWSNGERFYYANLASAFSTQVEFSFPNPVFHGFLGMAVSRIDNPTPASVTDKNSWKQPVVITSHQGQTSFMDKEQVWADNASSSQFFGHVYVCGNDFRALGKFQNGNEPTPMSVYRSSDGGSTWTKKQVTSAQTSTNPNTPNQFGYSGCTIRTDSNGVVYLFAERFTSATPESPTTHSSHVMWKSFDGGAHWTKGQVIAHVTDPCYFTDPVYGRCVMDGYAGARTDLAASPSISIANGAPTGAGATDEIVDGWADAPVLNGEKMKLTYSTNAGAGWSTPANVSLPGDRPLYAAPAISPNGSQMYVIYEADTAPWAGTDMTSPRPYHGVFRSASVSGSGAPGSWTTLYNEPPGDLRASYPGHDIYQERVGDYVYAAASNSYGVGLWASTFNASVCDAVQAYRAASLALGGLALPAPWPLADCPANWGNVDIRSATTG